ncbi:hypothetical protein C8R46DRAFT_1097561 [Mycena filopes]|nr:hypothetical protein C8R46DRAFT_1097561 [Mycena filopes]
MVDPTTGRLSMPSLQFLRISIADDQDADYLPAVFDLFDTPVLTEFMIHGTHVDQIIVLFKSASLPRSSFPALMSLTFANYADCCAVISEVRHRISPPRLFPVLSSLSLISQCFTSIFVNGMFASTAPPWPLLKTLTVCPLERDRDVVSDALWNARTTKPRTLPRFKLSGSLLVGMRKHEKESDKESGMDMELFDPSEIMAAFH